VKTAQGAAHEATHHFRVLRQRFFRHDDVGDNELQIVAVKERLVEAIHLGDQTVELIEHAGVDDAGQQCGEPIGRRFDSA
jgi:hypothetical protein